MALTSTVESGLASAIVSYATNNGVAVVLGVFIGTSVGTFLLSDLL